jgi:hypothetical protein
MFIADVTPCHGFSVIAGVVETVDTGKQLLPVTTTPAINLLPVATSPELIVN